MKIYDGENKICYDMPKASKLPLGIFRSYSTNPPPSTLCNGFEKAASEEKLCIFQFLA